MSDAHFGYLQGQNTRLGLWRQSAANSPDRDSQHWFNYLVAPTAPPEVDYAELDFRGNTIERIYPRVMAQDVDALYAIARGWHQMWELLNGFFDGVYRATSRLRYGDRDSSGYSGWTGDGAEAFVARGPGATLKSLDDWRHAARSLYWGANSMANSLNVHKAEMQLLWNRYQRAVVAWSKEWLEENWPGEFANPSELDPAVAAAHQALYRDGDVEGFVALLDHPDYRGTANGVDDNQAFYANFLYQRAEIEGYNAQARQIQHEVAESYLNVIAGNLLPARPDRYEGPADAVKGDAEALARGMVPDPPDPALPGLTPPIPPAVPALSTGLAGIAAFRSIRAFGSLPTAPGAPAGSPTPPAAPRLPALGPGAGGAPRAPGVPGAPGLSAGRPIPPGAPAAPGTPPRAPDPGGLVSGLSSETVAGVLRGPAPPAPAAPTAGMPPTLPPGARSPRAAPSTPPVRPRGAGGSGDSSRRATAPPVVAGPEQFGPPAPPPSPVLRGPRADAPRTPGGGAPSAPGGGSGQRGTGQPAADRRRRAPGRPAAPATPLAGDAVPPVLGRPQPAPVEDRPPRSPEPARPAAAGELVPPTPAMSSPVVGRPAPPAPAAPPPPRPASGVVTGRRPAQAGAGPGALASRRKGPDEPGRSEREPERDRQSLADEEAWTVETPGGGVVDGAPAQPVTKQTEPKPALGS